MVSLSGSWKVGVVIWQLYVFFMLCSKYTIIEKFRVNLVAKVNVERWDLFLMLVKS